MKLEEMILVTKNMEGEQANYLTSFNDYLKTIIEINGDKPEDLAHAITELFDTKEKPTYWSEQYIATNITVHARFCHDEMQLRGFLFGYYNENNNGEKGFTFDTESCLEECLTVLEAYNMKTDGHIGNASFKYERLEHDFQTGEIIRNLNGNSYRVLDVLTEENILFLSVSSGEINIGLDTKYYAKTPEGEGFSADSILYGISWGHGIYLGNNITKIDFDEIRRGYGGPEQIGTLADYRLSIKKTFHLYKKLMENDQVSDTVRKAASSSIYEEFGTSKNDRFLECLYEGKYDGGFLGQEARTIPTKTVKTR